MSDKFNHLRRLVHLASEPSSEKRRDLLREITDVFMTEPDAFSEKQNWYFGEIMGQLAYDLEIEMRTELAERLAAEGSAPKDLIRCLASDEICIARPVLEQSPVLTQDDLIEITQNQSQDHLRAITVRPDIGNELSHALVNHGDDSVVVGLLQNESAQIHDTTMGRIAARSVGRDAMQGAIVDRRNVPKEILAGLIDKVSDQLRSRILERYADVNTEELDGVFSAMKDAAAENPRSAAERYIDSLVRRGVLTEGVLTRMIAENKLMEFMVGFARLLQIDLDEAQAVLADPSGTPLTVLCRANDIGPEAFKEMALSPMTGLTCNPDEVLPLVRIYMRLKIANAQRAVRFWQARKLTLESIGTGVMPGAPTRPQMAPAAPSAAPDRPPQAAGMT